MFLSFQLCEAQPARTEASPVPPQPVLNGVVPHQLHSQKRVLPYDALREADVVWEKQIWRGIDTREKINMPFAYPEMTFLKS